MAIVRGSTTIKRISRGDTLSATLISTKSTIQFINGAVASPDWTNPDEQPTIYIYVRSNNSTRMLSAISDVRWYFDGKLINEKEFKSNKFKLGEVTIPAVTVIDNVMLNRDTDTRLEVRFNVDLGDGKPEPMVASIEFKRLIATDDVYYGDIEMSNGGILSSDTPVVKLKAVLRRVGKPVNDSDFEVKWFEVVVEDTDGVKDGLRELPQKTKTIELRPDDISLNETYYAKFYIDGKEVAVASDNIIDNTDPYELIFNLENSGLITPEMDKLRVTAIVSRRMVNNQYVPDKSFNKFAFTIMDGLTFIREKTRSNENFIDVKYEDFSKANGNNLMVWAEAYSE